MHYRNAKKPTVSTERVLKFYRFFFLPKIVDGPENASIGRWVAKSTLTNSNRPPIR